MARLSQNHILATIIPTFPHRWPDPGTIAFNDLRAAAQALRDLATGVNESAAAEEADRDLSKEGVARKLAATGIKALQELDAFKPLSKAQASTARALAQLEEKMGELPAAAEKYSDVALAAEIRGFLLKQNDLPARFKFVNDTMGDKRVVSAVISAPAFLSGFSDEAQAIVKHRARASLHPEQVALTGEINKYLGEVTQGVEATRRLIMSRTNVRHDPDGVYRAAAEPVPVLSLSKKGEAA